MATINSGKPGPSPRPGETVAAAAAAEPKRVKVKTTLPTQPLPPNASRPPIHTQRLVLRAIAPSDLAGVHALRTQREVMVFTAVGRADRDHGETRAFMDRFLAPNDARTYNFAICLAGTGELVGTGGLREQSSVLGWPEVGYMLRREHWGRGYATEFLRACLGAWWALPRSRVEIEVDAASVGGQGGGGEGDGEGVLEVPEMVAAIVDECNLNSTRVLKKAGFREFKTWAEPDSREGYDMRDVSLIGLVATSPGQ